MITVNDISVFKATIDMPLSGVWTSNLTIDQKTNADFGNNVKVTIKDDAGLTFNGVVVPDRSGSFTETLSLRIWGGAGGLWKTPTPKSYKRSFVKDIINQLMKDSGETLSDTADKTLLNTQVGDWSIYASSCSSAINKFLAFLGPDIRWRILPDGKFWFGKEDWKDKSVNYTFLEFNPIERKTLMGISNLEFAPGINITEIGHISRIQYQINSSSMRAVVWTEIEDTGTRGVLADFDKLTNTIMDKMKYAGLYLGNVTSQKSDYSEVDITSVDDAVPSPTSVRVLSGYELKLTDEQVLFGWIGMNPNQPFCIPFLNPNSSAQFVALENLVNNNHNAIQNGLNTHIHLAGGFTAPPGGGAVTGVSGAATPDGYYTPSSVAATKVKAV